MATMYDVPINDLIEKVAEKLKKLSDIKAPEWAHFAKTGMSKQRPPANADWWYMRASAILCTVRKKGPVGVEKLRTKYGGKKNRGHKPERFYKGSGSVIRKCLQQLEKAGLIEKKEKDVHKGRIITKKGVSLIDKTAGEIKKMPNKEKTEHTIMPKPQVKKEVPKEEKPKTIQPPMDE
jgi:small subunit ribosomal protein S19e